MSTTLWGTERGLWGSSYSAHTGRMFVTCRECGAAIRSDDDSKEIHEVWHQRVLTTHSEPMLISILGHAKVDYSVTAE